MAYYKTNIDVSEQQDLGLAIQKLIESNIKNASTAYLAQITSIVGNKLHIKPIIKENSDDKEVIINNALVAFPASSLWSIQYKLAVGDIGLVVANDKDLSVYKNSGKGGTAQTKRYKNISDAIFFPVSMFNTAPIDSIDFAIQKVDDIAHLICNGNQWDLKENLHITGNLEVDKDATIKGTTTTDKIVANTGEIKNLTSETITTGTINVGGKDFDDIVAELTKKVEDAINEMRSKMPPINKYMENAYLRTSSNRGYILMPTYVYEEKGSWYREYYKYEYDNSTGVEEIKKVTEKL